MISRAWLGKVHSNDLLNVSGRAAGGIKKKDYFYPKSLRSMNIFHRNFLSLAALAVLLSFTACKSKKKVLAPAFPPAQKQEQPKEEAPAPEKPKAEAEAPAPAPDYNFKNIQFEFNSVVLKTGAYELLEKAATEIKKTSDTQFVLNGHSSEEGSSSHNMSLSVDRANAVKTYLVNAGIAASRIEVKGFGETKPVASNADEAGRALNRRVEIKLK